MSDEKKPLEHESAVVREANEDRAGLLDELFGVMPSASRTAKDTINQNFSTPEGERREAHSPLLQRKVASKHIVDQPTLTESVRVALRRA